MKGKSATTRLSSLYGFLWGIPLKGSLLSLAVVAQLASALSIGLVGGLNYQSIILVVACFQLSILVNWLSGRVGDVGMLNFRRMNQLSIINSALIVLGALASLAPPGPRVGMAIIAVGAFLRVSILLTQSGRKALRAIPLVASAMLLEALPGLWLFREPFVGFLAKPYLIGSLFAAILLIALKKFVKIRGSPALDYISGLLAYLLDGRVDWISELAANLDDESEVHVDVLFFRPRGGRPELALVIPTFHPGPFKDFGSSGLPYRIHDELGKLGVETFFLKGFSGHRDNLIAEEDCELIADELRRIIAENSSRLPYLPYCYAPIELESDGVKGVLLGVGAAKLLLVTLHPEGMEDIPRWAAEVLVDPSIIPVDCHNSFSKRVKDLDEDALKRISDLLRKAESMSLTGKSPLTLGYSRVLLEGYSRVDGAGDLGVSALVFMLEDSPTAIISLDGNNCLPEVRDEIVRRVKKLGFRVVEAATTDTHVVNGLKFGEMGYHPLGEVVPAEVIAERAVRAVKLAMASAKPMEAAWTRLRFMSVKIMSPDFLEEAAEKAHSGAILFFLLLAAAFLGALL
ncbi:MAG TPA: DUF2070 family protein [Nitrososphaeria archaeon]|nr:DUF2070 family protein [Nitrososphaeria archaeon]